jgi:hypothetical protein
MQLANGRKSHQAPPSPPILHNASPTRRISPRRTGLGRYSVTATARFVIYLARCDRRSDDFREWRDRDRSDSATLPRGITRQPAHLVSYCTLKLNGTDLRKFITIDQSLCRGSGGGTRPPVGGLGGTPPNLGFSQTVTTFHLSQCYSNYMRDSLILTISSATSHRSESTGKW